MIIGERKIESRRKIWVMNNSAEFKKIKPQLVELYKLIYESPHPSEIECIPEVTNYDEGDCYQYFALVVGSMDYLLAGKRSQRNKCSLYRIAHFIRN